MPTEAIYNLAILINSLVIIIVIMVSNNLMFIIFTVVAMTYLTQVEAKMYRKSIAANKEKG